MDRSMELEGGVPLQGCCRRCRLRLGGLRRPDLYRFTESEKETKCDSESLEAGPRTKKSKVSVCICCLGLLQSEFWSAMLDAVKNEIFQNGYDSDTFACGLSYPPSILMREHSINLHMKETDPHWKNDDLVPLKQAWKWSFGQSMATTTNKSLDSGAISQFLITLHTKYKEDHQELESLKSMVPQVFIDRSKSFKKYRGEDYSRVSIDSTLSKIEPSTFKKYFSCPPKEPENPAECTHVECYHNPIYLGGRYIKFSRELSQTPWIVDGKRIMEGSIQEIIFQPIVDFYKIKTDSIDNRLKFISSGREDVDVRCLGSGRPFAVEINNPTVTKLTSEQLQLMTNSMDNQPDLIKVTNLQLIQRSDLQVLKMGEEVKTKTYIALCIKLENKVSSENKTIHSNELCNKLKSVLTAEDLNRINMYSENLNDMGFMITQKTPLRVLHRRPLLTRSRKIHQMHASPVNGKPNMFTVELTTQAGTYIKEFVHGDFGRTTPNLSHILGFKVDILALDVKSVNLEWPTKPPPPQ